MVDHRDHRDHRKSIHTGILVMSLGVTDQQINSPGELKDEAVIKMERVGTSTFCLKPDMEDNETRDLCYSCKY